MKLELEFERLSDVPNDVTIWVAWIETVHGHAVPLHVVASEGELWEPPEASRALAERVRGRLDELLATARGFLAEKLAARTDVWGIEAPSAMTLQRPERWARMLGEPEITVYDATTWLVRFSTGPGPAFDAHGVAVEFKEFVPVCVEDLSQAEGPDEREHDMKTKANGPRRVEIFFYGSFINLDVLAEVELRPTDVRVARLPGFDLHIGPLANLVPSEQHSVYGIVCQATHAELARLYRQGWVGTYLPEAVLVEMVQGGFVPALCYLDPGRAYAPPSADYVERIAGPARELGFPAWYLQRIESFRVVPG